MSKEESGDVSEKAIPSSPCQVDDAVTSSAACTPSPSTEVPCDEGPYSSNCDFIVEDAVMKEEEVEATEEVLEEVKEEQQQDKGKQE